MEKSEFDTLKKVDLSPEKLTIDDLENKHPRTLLYEYTTERDTWHVYIDKYSNEIVTIVYTYPFNKEIVDVSENEQYVPNKRLYPHACDFEFCKLLAERGVHMSFTTWVDKEETDFYGETIIE